MSVDMGEFADLMDDGDDIEESSAAGPITIQTGDGILFYDLETVPDESRFPRPKEHEPTGAVIDFGAAATWGVGDFKPVCQSSTDEQLADLENWEREGKSRKGVLDLIKSTRDGRTAAFSTWMKKCSVSPIRCRIVALGYAIGDGEPTSITATNDDEERQLLTAFWGLVDGDRIRSGYNILGFDDVVVGMRSIILGVTPSRRLDRRRFNNSEAIDVMLRLYPSGQAEPCKDVCRALGIEIPAGDVDGSHVFRFFEAGMMGEIADYVRSDVAIERELFNRIGDVFGG